MKRIQLTQGRYTIVDDCDYDYLSLQQWHVVGEYGVKYACSRPTHRGPTFWMHRIIMQPLEGLEVDHINGDGLDNRRSNLRVCTHKQNCGNRRPNQQGISRFKGVNWDKGKWTARLRSNGKEYYFGRFLSEFDAAGVYDRKAKEIWGEFAYQNFPQKSIARSMTS